jgi:hypothetical protein
MKLSLPALMGIASFLLSTLSQAALPPQYDVVRRIDFAVQTMSTEVFNYKTVGIAPITSIQVNGHSIEVGIGNTICKIEVNTVPSQIIGPGQLEAIYNEAIDCGVIHEDLKSAAYSKVKTALSATAAKNKIVKSVIISATGRILIKTKAN